MFVVDSGASCETGLGDEAGGTVGRLWSEDGGGTPGILRALE
jgi:hypothetical protein